MVIQIKGVRLPKYRLVRYIPISRIDRVRLPPSDRQSAENLRASIELAGIINPVVLRRAKLRYELVCGARRVQAAEECGLSEVPAIIVRASCETATLIRLIENGQREEENFVLKAEELKTLVYNCGYSIERAAAIAGLTFAEATSKLRVLRLDKPLLNAVAGAGLTEKHALSLLRVKDENLRETAFCEMAYRGVSADAADKYIDTLLDGVSDNERAARNIHLFTQSVEKSIDILRGSGIEAEIMTEENDGDSVITIKLPMERESAQ